MTSELYTRDILRLAASIPHHRRLEQADASVARSSPVCGSRIVVDIALDGGGRVARIGQEVRACALGQASAALMAGHVIGRSADDLALARDRLDAYLAGRAEDPGDWPGMAVFRTARAFPARHRSILLAFEAAAEAAAQAQARAFEASIR